MKKKTKIIIGVLFLLCVCGIISNNSNNTKETSTTVTIAEQKENEIPENAIETEQKEINANETKVTEIPENSGGYSEHVNGRGRSDVGREEPQYENLTGYVAVYDSSIKQTDAFMEVPWVISTYEKDKQFYAENGTVDHKTEIIVKSQELEHEGYGQYSGYLLVERLDNGEQFYINVSNFITEPYWTGDIETATTAGYCIAEFNQSSDYYPVTKSNEKVELDDGTKVLIIGKTGTYGGGGVNKDTNSIEAIVFKEWTYGYGGVSVFFNSQDLTIVY